MPCRASKLLMPEPAEPAGPCTPAGPTGPVGPAAPVGPAGPAGPSAPLAPDGPIAPAGPAAPDEPGAPAGPAAPDEPGAPAGPAGPLGPATPCCPAWFQVVIVSSRGLHGRLAVGIRSTPPSLSTHAVIVGEEVDELVLAIAMPPPITDPIKSPMSTRKTARDLKGWERRCIASPTFNRTAKLMWPTVT